MANGHGSPVLSVNIKSMGDITSGVPMLLALLKAYPLCLLFYYFFKVAVLHDLGK